MSMQSFAQKDGAHINWMTLEEAQAAAKESPRPIIIDLYTPWCGPCKMMERTTFSDANVVKYVNDNYYAVKFNAEGPDDVTYNGKVYKNAGYDSSRGSGRNSMHDLTRYFGVPGYPTLVILNAKGAKIESAIGYKNAEQLMEVMKSHVGK